MGETRESGLRKRSRKSIDALRDEAEARGISYWDDGWTRADFEDAFARQAAELAASPSQTAPHDPEPLGVAPDASGEGTRDAP